MTTIAERNISSTPASDGSGCKIGGYSYLKMNFKIFASSPNSISSSGRKLHYLLITMKITSYLLNKKQNMKEIKLLGTANFYLKKQLFYQLAPGHGQELSCRWEQ